MASEHVSFGDFAIFIRRSNENPKIAKNRLRKRMNKGFGDFAYARFLENYTVRFTQVFCFQTEAIFKISE
jgi:phage FluMu gp28-like protein